MIEMQIWNFVPHCCSNKCELNIAFGVCLTSSKALQMLHLLYLHTYNLQSNEFDNYTHLQYISKCDVNIRFDFSEIVAITIFASSLQCNQHSGEFHDSHVFAIEENVFLILDSVSVTLK